MYFNITDTFSTENTVVRGTEKCLSYGNFRLSNDIRFEKDKIPDDVKFIKSSKNETYEECLRTGPARDMWTPRIG
jgi:hypothetical protein